MNVTEKLELIAKERADHQKHLESLQAALDAAADAGELADVKSVQAEIAAVQEFVSSCDRRAEKLQSELTAEQIAARRISNAAALEKFKDVSKRLPPRAEKIGKVVATLAAELKAFHADAHEAGAAAFTLIEQVQQGRAHDYLYLASYVNFDDNVLGHSLGDEMRRAGIFADLAQHANVAFPRLDMPPIGEFIADRVDYLIGRVEHCHHVVSQSFE